MLNNGEIQGCVNEQQQDEMIQQLVNKSTSETATISSSLKNTLASYERALESKDQCISQLALEMKEMVKRIKQLEDTCSALNEESDKANDTNKKLRNRVYKLEDELIKVANEYSDVVYDEGSTKEELKDKLTKIMAGNKVLKQRKDAFEKELEEANKACTLYQTQLATEKANHHETHVIMTQEMDKMRNANIVLQQRVREAWGQVDKLQDEVLSLKTSRPNLPPPPQSHSQSPYGFTREADLALQEAEVARQQLEATRRVGQLQMKTPSSYGPAETIRENPVIEGIDREIHDVAEGIRRMTRPPPTQEIDQDDGNSDIPYDPNLTCPGCGQRYRFGEIQKLRRHVNETCPARDKCTVHEQNKMVRDQKGDTLDTDEMVKLVRRESQAPSTDEVINPEDNSDIPYDPNLTCPGCGQRYRFGEIQKLRRHVNEFCTAQS